MPVDSVRLGPETCGVLDAALRREWLVTNGAGGYASGTLAGGLARRYHGLLVAATEPPVGRTVTVAGLEEAVLGAGPRPLYLHTQEWASGAVSPRGHELIDSFEMDGLVPVWRYALAGAQIEKRVWMEQGASTTYVTYTLRRGAPGVDLRLALRPLCTWRDHPWLRPAGRQPAVEAVADGVRVAFPGAPPYWVRASGAEVDAHGDWYRGLRLRIESERGMDDVQDLYAAGTLTVPLRAGAPVTVCISLDESASVAAAAVSASREADRTAALVRRSTVQDAPPWVQRLVLAAGQLLAVRAGLDTVMAGYPWFGDWGRDTMISLPGLALVTGRPEVSAGLLRGFARYVTDGLLPNRFPDHGETPQYNTIDATLWYVEAIRAHVDSTGDDALLRELWPVLEEIVRRHVEGTRHGIGVDPADGLVRGGEPGVQLTWMDAKVDRWVVTPRIGKPVEINALWHNALAAVEGWIDRHGLRMGTDVAALRARVAASFDRYWNDSTSYLYDVLDGPSGDDAAVRPNAVIAAALPATPLGGDRLAAVVARAQRELLTPLGLRSLSPADPAYTPNYLGDLRTRDAAYHQGTVWPWLIGPFVAAHLRVHGDPALARSFLEPFADNLRDAGLGSVSEIADADPPHAPRGCPWQAWSVAEVLRAWQGTAGAAG